MYITAMSTRPARPNQMTNSMTDIAFGRKHTYVVRTNQINLAAKK